MRPFLQFFRAKIIGISFLKNYICTFLNTLNQDRMQNKGLITVFAILFGLVSLYQLSFTFVANQVEDAAQVYANERYDATQSDERQQAVLQYIDSVAAEHSARMQAMDAATNNAKEMVKKLTVQFNKARQEAITTELIEVVSGAESLNG